LAISLGFTAYFDYSLHSTILAQQTMTVKSANSSVIALPSNITNTVSISSANIPVFTRLNNGPSKNFTDSANIWVIIIAGIVGIISSVITNIITLVRARPETQKIQLEIEKLRFELKQLQQLRYLPQGEALISVENWLDEIFECLKDVNVLRELSPKDPKDGILIVNRDKTQTIAERLLRLENQGIHIVAKVGDAVRFDKDKLEFNKLDENSRELMIKTAQTWVILNGLVNL
jgi:hypothetical protein